MKKIIIAFLLFTCLMNAQKIVENKVDEFTKNKVVRTDWEKISDSRGLYLYSRISKIDDSYYVEMKIPTNYVTSINPEDDVSFMFENNEIINLKSTEYKITCYGCGSIGLAGSSALGLGFVCKTSNLDIEKFKNNLVKKIRINKSTGYSEDELKSKNSEKLRSMFLLF